MHTTVIIPKAAGQYIRKIASEQDRTLSDIFSEMTRYWLDVNYPEWDMIAPGQQVEQPEEDFVEGMPARESTAEAATSDVALVQRAPSDATHQETDKDSSSGSNGSNNGASDV